MQRTAIQGHPTTLTKITNVYQPGSEKIESDKHPFRYHFEDITIGQTLTTHKRSITEADIVNFANVSWDHFYAHTDDTSFERTFFERRVAHGYFIMSAAAGLFVDPGKGPVLANYGLEELRFVKPVYVGATIQVQLTAKEKIDQEAKGDDAPRGVVKWQVEVFDEEKETVALGTILTLVAKK
jgi:oxepin-CoA hydrolase/3-oxo-5,6-dehydrosuberyl-CoA semialdehyde dehydrogenase